MNFVFECFLISNPIMLILVIYRRVRECDRWIASVAKSFFRMWNIFLVAIEICWSGVGVGSGKCFSCRRKCELNTGKLKFFSLTCQTNILDSNLFRISLLPKAQHRRPSLLYKLREMASLIIVIQVNISIIEVNRFWSYTTGHHTVKTYSLN